MTIVGLRSIDHLVIATTDIAGAVAWYRDVLGFEQEWEEIVEGAEFEALVGAPGARTHAVGGTVCGLRVEFNHASWNPAEPRSQGTGLSIFSCAVDDADKAYEDCKAKGLTFAMGGAVHDAAGCKIFFVEAPDKQVIEFVEFTAASDSPWNTYAAR
jgi:catechol 2,3-dioxygenase-like lactoylglutathione lyase family enzyme